jgi:hypothetical protein
MPVKKLHDDHCGTKRSGLGVTNRQASDEDIPVGASSKLRAGVVCWQENDGFAMSLSSVLEKLGYETVKFEHNGRLPRDLDIIFAYGPHGSLVPHSSQLLHYPPSLRPAFILWLTEQLPNPSLPDWVLHWGGVLRSQAERFTFREKAQGEWRSDPRLRLLVAKAHRFRYYGDLHWLHRQGILSVLAVGSRWIAEFLRLKGFNPIVAYIGSHTDWWADLELERDIPVLWIGKIATGRRKRLLKRIRAELRDRGVALLMIDGVENPYVFGEERSVLLNRTKIVLNILRTKWDNHSLRYFLAAPNRALIVTEPTLPHTTFLSGTHLVEAPIDQLADAICYYLSHEEDRHAIVDQAYQLTTKELTMENSIKKIIAQISILKKDKENRKIL